MIKKVIIGYIVLWVLTALYQSNFGDMAYRSFMFNLGRTIFWMDFWFDSNVGKTVGGILLPVILGYIGLKSLRK